MLPLILNVVAAQQQFQVGVQATGEHEIARYADITLGRNGIFKYEPSSSVELPSEGCIGIFTETGFSCHTLFKKDDGREAVRAFIAPDGSLSQVQLAMGPKTDFYLEAPEAVARPAIAAVQPKKATIEGEEEAEKGFLAKYWMYLVPAGLVVLSNAMKPKPAE